MDYYIVVNGQKQGPYDLLGVIKKVKNGIITAETSVSTNPEGPFVRASEFSEISAVLTTQADTDAVLSSTAEGPLTLKRITNDAFELWSRKIIEFTMLAGIIVVLGIIFSMVLKKVQIIADYSFVADYFCTLIISTLLGIFSYYVLINKRNQVPDSKEISAVFQETFLPVFGFSAILSLAAIAFGINVFIGLITLVVVFFIISSFVFVPFLITDHKMKLGRAMRLSLSGFKASGASGTLAIFVVVGINVVMASLPALLGSQAAFVGIILVLPIALSTVAYIYDQVLA